MHIIKEEMKKKWQEEWNKETKARMYYSIQGIKGKRTLFQE